MELAIVGQMKQLQLKKLESVPIGNDHDDEDYLECLKNEASLLASLGRVYFERGRASRQLGDLIRSAALYNSALARSVKRSVLDESGVENLPSRKLDVESELLSLLTGKRRRVANNNAEKLHRSELDKMRQMCCREIRDIDSNCSPYTAGGDEHWERVQESKRMRSIQRLYRDFNKRLRSMVTEMWKSCVQTLGRPNCKYALLATGDFGRGTVTPYADLELAVLIEESADMRRDKQLLKSLMQYLLLKFLNLGETILPSLGIKSINNFANPDGNWFIDLDTPRGVALHIPKPPVGAVSLDKAILIKTPSKMVKFLLETSGGRMRRIQSPGSLLTVSFLAGSELLARNYQELVDCLLERPANPLNYGTDSDLMRSRIAESMLTRICRSCKPVIGLGDSIARFRNDLWIPTAIVSALALLSGISPGNPWSVLDEFRKRRQLRPEIINKLTFLLSVSAESKLKMEILRFAKSQTTAAIDLSIITSGPAMTDSYQSVCKFYELLFHFADLAKEKLLKIPDPTAALESFQNNFVSTPTQQANIQLNLKLANHAEVDKVLLAAAEKDPENDRVTTDLICVLLKTRALSKISSVYAVLVQKLLAKIDSSTNDGSHEYDASTEGKTNFIKEARIFLQRSENALKREGDAEDDEMVLERAVALNNLGVAWFEFGKADKAQLCFQQCFMLWRRIHLSENGIHDDVADCLNKLGLCYGRTNDEENSIAHHRLALQMYLKIHDGDKAHPDIADTLVKLAHALGMSRKFHQALISQKEALHIFQVLWSCAVPHPDVAACLHGLGKTFYVLSQYDRALLCHTKAVSMYSQLYGEDPVRMEVAECFETLAEDFRVTGRLSDAIYNLEKASAIYEQIYGTNIPNPRLTYCYDNLGAVYYSSGDYENATMCYEQSLAMARAMHGDKYASIKLAEMMTNLGNARIALGEYDKAVECHRQVCKMYDTIHDKTLLHVDKVNGLCDLGSALELLGDFAGAIQCHQQAMEMAEKLNAGGAVSRWLQNARRLWEGHGVSLEMLKSRCGIYRGRSTCFKKSTGKGESTLISHPRWQTWATHGM
ncbi:uncharacterized protein [Ptychodera flava]|uniref:uncharacterized protein n=1 Tax=Ptychodera flava TaxID=63121 RepID=UPI00396A8716